MAAREGTGWFTVDSDRSMSRLAGSGRHNPGDIQVRVVTLDGMVERGEVPPPMVVKCDVEDAELDVLRGAEALLRAHHPAILLDTHSESGQMACCRFLSDLGYRLTMLDGLPQRESGELLAVWRERK